MQAVILIIIFLSSAVVAAEVRAQQLTQALADSFAADLLKYPAELEKWVQPDELSISKRLGIQYYEVPNKFLISYDVSESMRQRIGNSSRTPEVQIQPLDAEHTKLSLKFRDMDYNGAVEGSVEYYFYNNRLISPMRYHARHWHRFESEYFVFYLSDWSLFNDYSARRLDAFVASTLHILDVPQESIAKLQNEKIYYYRCRDTYEIQKITGYPSRGMYNLAYDYIITTYNCHYHEIVHLLVNFKLQDAHLLTNPFFQEGIAVALGGRGGREKPVIMNLGLFLEKSGFASYKDLLSYKTFVQMDASMSYPMSGLYTEFLIKEMGIENYMKLYEQFSGNNSQSNITEHAIPAFERWESYLQSYNGTQPVHAGPSDRANCNTIYADSLAEICLGTAEFHFKIKGAVLIKEAHPPQNYQSSILRELLAGVLYQGEKYLITANENEISVYNLYTDNLTAKYIPSMSVSQTPIQKEDGYHVFSLNKNVFEEDLQDLMIRTITGGGFRPQ